VNKNRTSEPTMKLFVYFISTENSSNNNDNTERLDDEMSFFHSKVKAPTFSFQNSSKTKKGNYLKQRF